MKISNLAALSFAGLLVSYAGRAAELTVICDNIRSSVGTMRIELDATPAAWDNKEKPAATADVKADIHGMTYTFKDLAPGKYGLG